MGAGAGGVIDGITIIAITIVVQVQGWVQAKVSLSPLSCRHSVKSGSSLGQSPDEFQIKGTRMEEQRLA